VIANVRMYDWKWARFQGSEAQLKWNRRDLPNLDKVIARVPQRRVAVQAGGNLGLFPKRLAMKFETVYTFEPAAPLFPLMLANAPEQNIVRFQAALGYHRSLVGTAQVRREGHGLAHEGITHVAGPGRVPTLRLDDLALPVCDLLQLDLEGWELYALQGAVATIERCRPVLCVEVNRNLSFVGLQPDDVRSFVTGLRYRFVERLESDEVYVPAEWPC
jgi:FkbM family methyltransferase